MESSTLTAVAPARPVFPYVGGKRSLSRRLVALIEATPHDRYLEPFVGGAGVFLRRTRRPRDEAINDISTDIATLFRILQRHYPQFLEVMRFQLNTRADFDRLTRTDPATLTDLERAARFLYLQKVAFGGKVVGRAYGMTAPGRFDLSKLEPMLADVHERLMGVQIERLPYADFLARYDRPGALAYCDPPYWGTEDYYGKALFGREDFVRLADRLRCLQGRFILSINDVPEIRELFAWAAIDEVGLKYRVSGAPTDARELIITGGG